MTEPARGPLAIGANEVLLMGCSLSLLDAWADLLPEGSVLVVEEPDVIRKRRLDRRLSGYPAVAHLVACRYQDPTDLWALLEQEHRLRPARAVVPGVEYAVRPAAALASARGLPGAGTEAARVLRDKHLLRLVATAAGLRNPAFTLARTPEDAEAFAAAIPGPWVVKPTARQASLGVRIVAEPGDLRAAWEHATAPEEGEAAPDRGVASDVLIECAARGPEYSVEMLVAGGEACFANVTAKELVPGPFPVEAGHTVPAPLPPALHADLIACTRALVGAVRFGSGVVHAEWITGQAGPVLVECAGRLPGDEIPRLIARAWGFSLAEAYLRCLLGERPACPAEPVAAAAVRFLATGPADGPGACPPGGGGTVRAVVGVAAARAVPGVEEVAVDVRPGDRVRPLRSSWDRAGHVLAAAPSPAAAAEAARRAAGRIRIELAGSAPPSPGSAPERELAPAGER